MSLTRPPAVVAAALFVCAALAAAPVSAAVDYQTPPEPIGRILDAPLPPVVFMTPDRSHVIEMTRPSLPPISELAEPFVPIAGVRVNPKTNGPAREYSYRSIGIKELGPGPARSVSLPKDPRIRNTRFSPTGKHLSFTLTQDDGIELWVMQVPDGTPQRLTGPILNAAYGAPCDWLAGDDGLVCKVLSEDRGAAPEESHVATGPLVEESSGRRAPARTYTNLLQNPHDEALFDHYMTSALDHVALDGERTPLVPAGIIDEASPSPDGRFILVETLHRPYSYHVPASRFPVRIEVIDRAGKVVHQVADLPLADDIPIKFGSTRKGPRSVGWRADRPATLTWVEALDDGDAGKEAKWRDALYQLDAPFRGRPEHLWKCEYRFGGVTWGKGDVALASEWWFDNRKLRTWVISPDKPSAAPKLLHDRSYQDAYSHPGSPLMTPGPHGRWVLRFAPDGRSIFMNGRGASPDGVYPFLDRLDLDTAKTRRLWQSEDPYYERVVDVLDDRARRFVTTRQSQDDPSNYYIRTRGDDSLVAITAHSDPAPELAGMYKEVVTYKRADGVDLSATLYLPPGHDEKRDGRLPFVLWAYPREFKDKRAASQVTTASNTFSRPGGSSVLFLLTQGYGVLSGPTMPIIGEGDEEPNDTFVEQLVASARAAVDYVVERGVADRDRLAIGGHSYGAFTCAHLLAHSDLFRAGIARSGAYNRTLTPFGFQGEQRSYWEATDTYIKLSPFTHAAKIDEPMLMIHGEDDSNSGTYPVQSERMYEAMKGLGGTVRWVVLPHEDHGYRSRESVGHVHWETVRWLDMHVKSAPSSEDTAKSAM